jgi:hypothetical protein
MGAVGASLTTDLADLISARVWLCAAQVQRALVQALALAARPATTTGCSGGGGTAACLPAYCWSWAGACSAVPPSFRSVDLWRTLLLYYTARAASWCVRPRLLSDL